MWIGFIPDKTEHETQVEGKKSARWPISRVLSRVIIPLGDTLPHPSSNRPGRLVRNALLASQNAAPIWSCSGWGLPCHSRYRERGALLPHRFTFPWRLLVIMRSADRISPEHASLRRSVDRASRQTTGSLFSVALSLESLPPGVTRHPVPWSPDFPRKA